MPHEEHDQDHAEEAPDRLAGAPADGGTAEAGDHGVVLSRTHYEELKTLARERDEYLRRLQRAVADYQNLQKRINRSRDTARDATMRSLAESLLPIADSLARAVDAALSTPGAASIVEGLHLVEKEFYGALERFDIRPLTAVGEPFDPHFHEALMQVPADGRPAGSVVQELKKGFVMGDIVIRPSQVVVTANDGPAPEAAEGEGDAAEEADA